MQRFHRAVSPDADYRYVNVARWRTLHDFQAAHGTEEFRRILTRDEWQEFPANPALYEVVVAVDAGDGAFLGAVADATIDDDHFRERAELAS